MLYELGAARTRSRRARSRTRCAIDAGQLSRLLNRLENQGLIERRPSPTDARRQQVRLTPDGDATPSSSSTTGSRARGRRACSTRCPTRTGAIAAMRTLQRAIEPAARADRRDPRPRARRPRLAGRAPRRALRPRVRLGRELRAARGARSPPTSTRDQDRAWIAETDDQDAPAPSCASTTRPTTAKLRTLLVEPHARGLGLGTRLVDEVIRHARRRGYTHADAVDQRRPARRAPHLRARRLRAQSARRPHHAFGHDLTEQTWSLTLTAMDRDALRALQAPLKEQYKTEPGQAQITLKATGTLGEGVSCSVDTGRAIAQAGLHPATGGDGSLLCSRRHAARGARRLRGRDARRRVARASTSRSTRAASTPRATSTSAARSASTGRRRSASRDIRLASSSTPTPTTSSSRRCSS